MVKTHNVSYSYFIQPLIKIDEMGCKTVSYELLLRAFNENTGKWELPEDFELPMDLVIDLIGEVLDKIKTGSLSVNLTNKQFDNEENQNKIISYFENENRIDILTLELVKAPTIEVLEKASYKFKDKGILICIDDVGSDNLLSDIEPMLPFIDKIKFASQNMRELEEKEMMKSLKECVGKANDLNLFFVLEGVETKENIDDAMKLGASYFQGYYYSKPILPDDLPPNLCWKA